MLDTDLSPQQQRIVDLLTDWFEKHGREPVGSDFLHGGTGVSLKTIRKYFGSWNAAKEAAGFEALPSHGRGASVPIEVVQEAFERSGMSEREIASAMGYRRVYTKANGLRYRGGDTSPIRRLLGKGPRAQTHVTRERALRFIAACGLDPVDFDL